MDCIPVGAKIITVSVQLHGTIIDLDLSPEMHSIFKNTRLFSYAGLYESAYTSHWDALQRMREMKRLFVQDIEGESMVEALTEYIVPLTEEYKEKLATNKKWKEEKISNVCKHIGPITVDKAFAKGDRTFIERCIHSYILSDPEDIYVVSVHEKIGENDYRLLSSREEASRGISKLSYFREKGRNDIADMLIAESKELPNFAEAKKQIDAIESDIALSEREKEERIRAIKDPIYDEVRRWKCTVNRKRDEFTSIRMSMLSRILQMLYGDDCYIQLLDYSCNEVSIFLPKEQYVYKKYYRETDIEQGIPGIKGGKGRKKKNTRRKRFRKQNGQGRRQTKRER